jgi:hypothetical protein
MLITGAASRFSCVCTVSHFQGGLLRSVRG